MRNLFHCFSCSLDFVLDMYESEVKFCPLCGVKNPYFVQAMTPAQAYQRRMDQEVEEWTQDLGEAFRRLKN